MGRRDEMGEDEFGGYLVERGGVARAKQGRSPSVLGTQRPQMQVWVGMWTCSLLASLDLVPKSPAAGL